MKFCRCSFIEYGNFILRSDFFDKLKIVTHKITIMKQNIYTHSSPERYEHEVIKINPTSLIPYVKE
jgi:hypothetical protein